MKNWPTALYRHFDSTGRLLYVGISLAAGARMSQHFADSEWAGHIARVTIEYFPDREAAMGAEYQAIQTEKPLWNVIHNTYNRARRRRQRERLEQARVRVVTRKPRPPAEPPLPSYLRPSEYRMPEITPEMQEWARRYIDASPGLRQQIEADDPKFVLWPDALDAPERHQWLQGVNRDTLYSYLRELNARDEERTDSPDR